MGLALALTVLNGNSAAVALEPGGEAEMAAAVREALRRDPEVRATLAEVEVANVQGDIARNGYLPALNASAGPESSGIGYDVSLSQTVYDWGQVRSTVQRADALSALERANYQVKRDDVALEVVELWLDIAQGRAQLDLTRGHIDRLSRLQSMAQERVEGRFSDQAELGRANLALSTAQANRARLNGDLSEAESAFEVLVGYPASRVLVPDQPAFMAALATEPQLEAAITASPLYKRAVHNAEAADAAYRESRAAAYPRLVVEGSVHKREIGGRLIDDTSIGLRLRLSTQQGFSAFQRPRLEQARRDAAQLGTDTVAREVKRKVLSLQVTDRALESRINALADQVSQSDGVRATYAEQFVVGRRDIQDLVLMENEYYEAERQIIELTIERLRTQYRAAAQLGLLAEAFAPTREMASR
ncbi:TolC family protein [Brevundimonas sp. UBA5866]|nr:TolC family protein [Brevundimonas sp. UBA5866]